MSMRFSNFSNKIWEYGVRSTSVICLKFILEIEGNLCLMHANTVQYPKKDVHRQNYFQHTHHQIQLSGCFSQQLQVIKETHSVWLEALTMPDNNTINIFLIIPNILYTIFLSLNIYECLKC